ncbi:Imm26 family immunity protein [Solibacillus sp. FSL K6-1523]|uniref:Imm26 family immunity protein n=1 Tax=Solibacillus sp. FSL K6-1523 TaxID=2921471 RepID=UPI0030F6CFD2
MGEFVLWGWEKKKRTMLRFIKPGDIFCFQYAENIYGFGRVLARMDVGNIVEIFNFISEYSTISKENIEESGRMFHPVNLDLYSLFDRKTEGEWRIIGHEENYVPVNVDNVYFTYGVARSCKKVDIYGNTISISEEEARDLPRLSILGDYHIKQLVKSKLGD